MLDRNPYHPDYGIPHISRIRILKLLDQVGLKQAASMAKVHETTLRRWKRDINWRKAA